MSQVGSAKVGTALVVSDDKQTRDLLIESLRPLAVLPEVCDEALAANRLLNRQKFEAVIVDMQLGEDALSMLEQLRFSPSNRTAVTFAILAGHAGPDPSLKPVTTFVLQRPLSVTSVSQTLRAAFGLMVRERRRYFRCPVVIPVSIRMAGPEELRCQSVNISEGGIAVNIAQTPEPSAVWTVQFSLPGRSSQIVAETKVRWHDRGNLVGLEFLSMKASQKPELQEWLASKLEETLPERVAALFRSAGT